MIIFKLILIGAIINSKDVEASNNEARCAYVRVSQIPKAKDAFEVQIAASPDVVKEGLTKTASLRCSGAPDTGEVLSITITHHGTKVAMVTNALAAEIMDGSTNIQVTGEASTPSSQPFIQLTWQLPSKPQLQNLACQITASNDEGQEMSVTKRFSFAVSPPTIMDVVKHMQNQTEKDARERTALEQKIDAQNQEITALNQEITALKQQDANQASEISRLNACTSKSVAFTALMTSARFTSKILYISWKQTVKWDSVTLNQGGAYDASTGEFTCVTSGLYVFDVHVLGDKSKPAIGIDKSRHVCFQLQKNRNRLVGLFKQDAEGLIDDASLSHVVQLQQGDVVRVWASCGSTLRQEGINTPYMDRVNYFSGHLVRNAECSTP